MKRLQIPLGIAALMAVVAVLTLSVDKPVSQPEIAEIVMVPQPSPQEVAEHRLKKEVIASIVKDYFQKAINRGQIIGAGVSIVQGDSILLADGFGKRHVNNQDVIDGHTAFRLGSLSKGFAGVLSAAVEKKGLINWNDDINKYLPEFELGGNHLAKVTIAHILSHSSGTPYHSYTDLVESGMDLEKIAPRFVNVQPISEPGAMYSYQNALFAFSGTIIEKVTKHNFGSEMKSNLFEPLEMEEATTNHKDFVASDNIAFPHRQTKNSWRSIKLTDKYDNAIAAGGVNASASDMAKWMRFLLGHNPDVLDNSTLANVFKPQVEIKGKRKYYQRWEGHQSSYYGFGWRIHSVKNLQTEKESTIIHHGGSVNDYRNEIAIFPEDDLGICVLFNSNTKLAKTVIPELHNLIKEKLNELDKNRTSPALATNDGDLE